jgi:hypothetical protein
MGGLSLRRRLPHRRTWIGGGWPSQTTWKGHLAPRMVAWPRQGEDRETQEKSAAICSGNGAHPPERVSFRAVGPVVGCYPDGITNVAQGPEPGVTSYIQGAQRGLPMPRRA